MIILKLNKEEVLNSIKGSPDYFYLKQSFLKERFPSSEAEIQEFSYAWTDKTQFPDLLNAANVLDSKLYSYIADSIISKLMTGAREDYVVIDSSVVINSRMSDITEDVVQKTVNSGFDDVVEAAKRALDEAANEKSEDE